MIRALHRWARRRDDHQRWILAVFLGVVLATTVVIGLREVLFRHSETRALFSLRTMILRRNRDEPFQICSLLLALHWQARPYDKALPINDRPLPGGRLRYHSENSLTSFTCRDLNAIEGLSSLPDGRAA